MTVDEIKQSITMKDVLNRYNMTPDKKGFINCPFHNEKTSSLRIYAKSFYCFGCGANSSIFDFVMLMENCSFSDAVKKLGGDEEVSFRQKRKMLYAQRIKDKTEKVRLKRDELYWSLIFEWSMLDQFKNEFMPTQSKTPHPLFLQALIRIPQIERELDSQEWW